MIEGTCNVLILSCGRRVELTRCFISARDSMGIDAKIICCDASCDAPALFFADSQYRVPRIDSGKYVDAVVEICIKENVKLVIPTIDTELPVLAASREYIEEKTGAKVLISNQRCIDICRDKTLSVQFFEQNGFGVPRTYSTAELNQDVNIMFPLFIKPKDGSSSINAFKVENREQLNFFLGYIKNPIVQECVSGTEYTVDVFADFEGKIISCVPRIRLATRSGEVLKGKIDMNRKIIADVTEMLKLLSPVGHITVQGFLGEDGIFRYIEINPRFGGGAPMSIKAGADSCKWLFSLLCGCEIHSDDIVIRDGSVFSRFDDCIEVR